MGLVGLSAAASAQVTPSKPTIHTIAVGRGGFRFTPPELKNVNVNDIVTFEFYPPDHHVIRAEFGSACVPYEYTGKDSAGAARIGFDSGVKLFDDIGEVGAHNWNLTVNDTAPIFFYCGAPNSCTKQLMVGAINPTDKQTLAEQILSAKNSDYQLLPGEKIPSEASSTLNSRPTEAPTSVVGDKNNDRGSDSDYKISTSAIAGIVVGGLVFLAICAALFFYVGRAKFLKEAADRDEASRAPGNPMSIAPFNPFNPMAPFSPMTTGNPLNQGPDPLPVELPSPNYRPIDKVS